MNKFVELILRLVELGADPSTPIQRTSTYRHLSVEELEKRIKTINKGKKKHKDPTYIDILGPKTLTHIIC